MKISFYIKFILSLVFTLHGGLCYSNVIFEDLTILVSSCDKYAPLWDPFFYSLFKHWPSLKDANVNVPIILIANNKTYFDHRVETFHIQSEKSWSDNILQALEKIQTKYVLIALEDYWLTEDVDELKLHKIFDLVQQEQIAMAQLSYNNPSFHFGQKHPTLPDAVYTDRYAQYKTTLQMAIWDKKALQTLLRPGEDPWEFEIVGTTRSHGYPGAFLNIAKDYPIKYLNATRQGHIEAFAIEYALKHNIKFDKGNLPIVDKSNYRITYQKYKKRLEKMWEIIKDPGAFQQIKTSS